MRKITDTCGYMCEGIIYIHISYNCVMIHDCIYVSIPMPGNPYIIYTRARAKVSSDGVCRNGGN